MTPVEEAFQKAVDRALCRVSQTRLEGLEAAGDVNAARRINRAMAELKKLRGSGQPDYGDRDVALFYTQWYMPQQINIAYSESTRILRECALPGTGQLQLVDLGAGTGAMILGITLAIATQPQNIFPKEIVVHQIDHPVMLELGGDIWDAILKEARRCPSLDGITRVMQRTRSESISSEETHYSPFPRLNDATRWLTAIHVAYEQGNKAINSKFDLLCSYATPHVRIRTVPSFKTSLLNSYLVLEDGPPPVDLCLSGSAQCTTSLRRRFRKRFGDQLSPLAADYLTRSVPWTPIGNDNTPVAETDCWAEAMQDD
ncbi:MAG: hypothetical protein OXI03_08595 [Chloroflexota bacterium]|nr:hypothetical protein [Chloroflexota bacterium]